MRIVHEGRTLETTSTYDLYWKFAAARQDVFTRRVAGEPPPWTDDMALAGWRYTNVYRASDRVSQYLIRNVIYTGSQAPEEVFFRTLLFKFFNKVETWEDLSRAVGFPSWAGYDRDPARYVAALDARAARGEPLYSGAYVMLVGPRLGGASAHEDRLRLLAGMVRAGAPLAVQASSSLADVYGLLLTYPSVGRFLAFQYALDLNYTELCDHGEMDFVVAGPGARAGIRACFSETGGLRDEDVIKLVAALAPSEFERLGLRFETLRGRPLQAVDCEHLFCEVSKYARALEGGRNKQRYRGAAPAPLPPQWYPPKWGLNPA